jgi:DNA invertase Pin-like site-specific DNA recombinase
MTENLPNTALGYARVSTEDQREGQSIDAQHASIEAYCRVRGFELVRVEKDIAVSGSIPIGKRKGGKIIVEAIERESVGHVIVTTLDRLFRNVMDCLTFITRLNERDVALHFVNMGGSSLDTRSHFGRFFLTMLSSVAELERGMISERTKAIIKHRKNQGLCVGPPPYGWKVGKDGKLEKNSKEQTVISFIKKKRKEGWTYKEISNWLERERIKPRGRYWYEESVRHIMKEGK